MPREARKETLAASDGSDFRHGRFEPGQRLGSRYRIVARLGEGGMGEVYRADDLELGQSVALKFLPERVVADESWLRRFRNEVRTARQIAHPNVCRIYDIAEQDGHVFLSMEYVDGEDLSGVLRRLGRPSREKAIEIARQICLGLAAAHDAKVLHRDLKPANIMIDGRGRVRITDFGLAGFLDELEGIQARAGTPAYMAPEQLTRGEVSVRSDVYTLGLILHELFTGRCVFDTNDIEELKCKHTSGSVSTPSSVTEDIDPVVERVIMRCLEPDPEQRPQSVYQVLAALPGGDPLAAALAAGETPAPELVANARDARGLRPAVAIGLLSAVVASILIMLIASSGSTVMPEQSPARLSLVAEQVMKELGLGDLPRQSVSGYDINQTLAESLRASPRSIDDMRASDWPPPYRYWRRWSEGGFYPSDPHFPELFTIDAPTDLPERTAMVAFDSTGRLIGLSVPPDLVDAAEDGSGDIDWSPIFELARLDADRATPVSTGITPPVYCESVTAWRIEASTEDQEPRMVVMGVVKGRPNYLEHVGLDDDFAPVHGDFSKPQDPDQIAWVVFDVLMMLLALGNLSAGRADFRNALRFALLIGGLYATMELLVTTLGGASPSALVYSLSNGRALGHVLHHGVFSFVYYLAIEPYVRRLWPRMLIGSIRALSGRLRDPMVGREVLIGLAVGSGLMAVLSVLTSVEWALGATNAGHLANITALRAMQAPSHFLSERAHGFAWAPLNGLAFVGVFVIIRLLVRHARATAVVSVVAFAWLEYTVYFFVVGDSAVMAWVYAIGIGGCLVWLYTRVGVLSATILFYVVHSTHLFSIEFDAWSTPYIVATLLSVLALAACGFWVALAGQPIFKDMLAEPEPAAR